MTSCLSKSKHVKLTQACYPKSKTADAKPNASELQYLAYYASSRPKKLIKVGAYIRQKVVKDVYWNRQTDTIVSLEVCATLIEKCHANLNLFAEDVMAVLQSATNSNDLIVLQHCERTFTVFCRYHDGSALGTDSRFTKSYTTLLERFSGFARLGSGLDQQEKRFVGVTSIASACSSQAMQTINNDLQLIIMMPAILDNLARIKEDSLYNLKQQLDKYTGKSRSRRHSLTHVSGAVHEPAPQSEEILILDDIALSSLASLRTLFESNNAVQIRDATNNMLIYFEKRKIAVEWSSILLQIVAEWTPINLRFHILGACLQQLETSELQGWPTVLQENLLYVIQGLLLSKVNLIGLSTTDVLDSLLNTASRLLQNSDVRQLEQMSQYLVTTARPPDTVLPSIVFLSRISDAGVAITAHSYYKAQVLDLFEAIMSRLSIFPQDLDTLSLTTNLFHLDMAIKLLRHPNQKRSNSDGRTCITMTSFDPYFSLLQNRNSKIRTKFVELFCTYLTAECTRMDKDTPMLRPNSTTARQLNFNLFNQLRDSTQHEADISTFLMIINTLCSTLPKAESISMLPLLYQLSTLVRLPATAEDSRLDPLIDAIRQALTAIVVACGQPAYATEIARGHNNLIEVLPKASDVITRLLNNQEVDISAEERFALESPWTTDPIISDTPRSVSLRQIHKMRNVSSANASRAALESPLSKTSLRPSASDRILNLKARLVNPGSGLIKPDKMHTQALDLDGLFQGLELQDLSISSVKNAPNGTARSLVPTNLIADSLTHAPPVSLGKVVA